LQHSASTNHATASGYTFQALVLSEDKSFVNFSRTAFKNTWTHTPNYDAMLLENILIWRLGDILHGTNCNTYTVCVCVCIRRAVKKFPGFFDVDGLVHREFVPPGQCYSSFLRASATSGRQGQWFLHHDNAPSHTSLAVPTPNRRALWISLLVTFGCSLFRKWASMGHVSQPRWTSNRMLQQNSGEFQKKRPAGASIDGARVRVCVCARALL
jgi:hypothetical protein